MARVCQVTGKTAMVGNNVSHSRRRTKRTFDVNLKNKRIFDEESGQWILMKVSTSGMRTIAKKGLQAALKDAAKKGYVK
ncbi:MAG: 50S ribosomal protein L28 [Bacteroidales bacterium]|nr:50S ribosomal protein L28 [Bacteroidales bacterium]